MLITDWESVSRCLNKTTEEKYARVLVLSLVSVVAAYFSSAQCHTDVERLKLVSVSSILSAERLFNADLFLYVITIYTIRLVLATTAVPISSIFVIRLSLSCQQSHNSYKLFIHFEMIYFGHILRNYPFLTPFIDFFLLYSSAILKLEHGSFVRVKHSIERELGSIDRLNVSEDIHK